MRSWRGRLLVLDVPASDPAWDRPAIWTGTGATLTGIPFSRGVTWAGRFPDIVAMIIGGVVALKIAGSPLPEDHGTDETAPHRKIRCSLVIVSTSRPLMNNRHDSPIDTHQIPPDAGSPGRWPLLCWFISSATLSVPQAAGPVAFSLLALNLTGNAVHGAAIILAMTLAQVAGAIPITRLGSNMPSTRFLRLLIVVRTLALASIALFAAFDVPFVWLVPLAMVAGSVNGAAFGYLRSVLNRLTPASRLPRALGISATLNEVTFVIAPVVASGLGTISPIVAVLALAILGAVPALLVPQTHPAHAEALPNAKGRVLNPSILLWLVCAAAGGAIVASVEIGAVALALRFGYEPALAIMFTVPLCLASVAGGVWVSVRNRMATRKAVLAYLSIMSLGSLLAAFEVSVAMTVLGAVLIGSVLAPLGTYYSLVLDKLAAPRRRAEVFALLRTANAVGVIVASAALTMFSLSLALDVVAGLMVVVTTVVGFASWSRA
ncbi:MFS transporter [Teichococcus vastitatis]|uniref:MFS transporter n=1 Tax=Teichococcus vastitatis TaxID=2307076 RepID=UPI00192E6C63|nr:MFS transporter [Pseudoroseomonas vastitatis]